MCSGNYVHVRSFPLTFTTREIIRSMSRTSDKVRLFGAGAAPVIGLPRLGNASCASCDSEYHILQSLKPPASAPVLFNRNRCSATVREVVVPFSPTCHVLERNSGHTSASASSPRQRWRRYSATHCTVEKRYQICAYHDLHVCLPLSLCPRTILCLYRTSYHRQ